MSIRINQIRLVVLLRRMILFYNTYVGIKNETIHNNFYVFMAYEIHKII